MNYVSFKSLFFCFKHCIKSNYIIKMKREGVCPPTNKLELRCVLSNHLSSMLLWSILTSQKTVLEHPDISSSHVQTISSQSFTPLWWSIQISLHMFESFQFRILSSTKAIPIQYLNIFVSNFFLLIRPHIHYKILISSFFKFLTREETNEFVKTGK